MGPYPMQQLPFIGFYDLHRRHSLLQDVRPGDLLLRHILCLLPRAVVKSGLAPASLTEPPVYRLRAVDIAHDNRMLLHLEAVVCRNQIPGAVLIFQIQLHCQDQAACAGPVRIRIGRHKSRKCKCIMLVALDKPAVSHLRADHIFSGTQHVCHVKGDIIDQLSVICPRRIQLVVACLFPVDVKLELSKSADLCFGSLYRFVKRKLLSCVKWFRGSICNPLFKHFCVPPSTVLCIIHLRRAPEQFLM